MIPDRNWAVKIKSKIGSRQIRSRQISIGGSDAVRALRCGKRWRRARAGPRRVLRAFAEAWTKAVYAKLNLTVLIPAGPSLTPINSMKGAP